MAKKGLETNDSIAGPAIGERGFLWFSGSLKSKYVFGISLEYLLLNV